MGAVDVGAEVHAGAWRKSERCLKLDFGVLSCVQGKCIKLLHICKRLQLTFAAVGRQRIDHHDWTQVAAANADVDDVSHGPASVSRPGSGAYSLHENPHFGKCSIDKRRLLRC